MKKSILQDEQKCYITGQTNNLHLHHIYRGVNRKISDKLGFVVYLAGWLHNQSDEGVHGKNGHELDMMLKRHCGFTGVFRDIREQNLFHCDMQRRGLMWTLFL